MLSDIALVSSSKIQKLRYLKVYSKRIDHTDFSLHACLQSQRFKRRKNLNYFHHSLNVQNSVQIELLQSRFQFFFFSRLWGITERLD